MSLPRFLEALRPFLWLALAAFLTGFLSYAAFGGSRASARAQPAYVPAASSPSSDDWNLPKRI